MDKLNDKSKEELIALIEKMQQIVKIHEGEDTQDFNTSQISFDQLAQTSPSAILIYTKDHVCYVNEYSAKLSGYTVEELLKMKFWDIVHPEYQEQVRNHGLNRLKGIVDDKSYQFPILTKNGEIHWIDFAASTISIGNKTYGIGIALDVTEKVEVLQKISFKNDQRIQFQKALFDLSVKKYVSLDEFYKIVNECTSANIQVERTSIWLFNEDQNILYCEDLFLASKGIHKKEMPLKIGRYPKYFKFLHENISVITKDAKNQSQTSELLNDYIIPFNIVSIIDIPIRSEGKVIGIVSCEQTGSEHSWTEEEQDFVSSIAELVVYTIEHFKKKETEELLTEAYKKLTEAYDKLKENTKILSFEKEQLEITLRSIGDGVIITDINGKITMINQITEILTGWAQSEAIGKPIEEVFNIMNQESGEPCENPVEKVIKTGNIIEIANHTALISRTGEVRIISDSAAPIKDKNGNISGIVLVFRDNTEQEHAKNNLRKSEENYRMLLKLASDAFFQGDKDGNFIKVNNQTIELTGYSKEELLNMNIQELFANNVLHDKPLRYDILNQGETLKTERILKKKDGNLLYIEMNSKQMPDGTYQSFFRDITERKQMEKELQQSEELYRATFENTGTATTIIEEDDTISFVNARFEALSKYSKQEIEGKKKWTEFVIAEDLELMQKQRQLRKEDRDAALKQYEFHFISRDGNIHNIRLTVDLIPGTKRSVASLLDITERKQKEETIIKSQQLFKTLAEVAPVGVFRTNANGNTTYVNPKWCELSGFTFEEALGPQWLEAIHSEDRERIQKGWVQATNNKNKSIAEYRFQRKDGSIVWVMGNAVPEWSNGKIIGYVGTITDITERKKEEKQKELNNTRLEAILRLNNMLSLPIRTITDFALDSAVKITESSIGFLAFVNEDQTILHLQAWSKQAMEECKINDKYFDFKVGNSGLLGEAIRQGKPVITNHYNDENELKKGLPNGHVNISNHLSIPIFDEDKIVLLVGVSNKPYDYDDTDVRQLTMLMNSLWSIINRKKTEEALRESEKRYRLVTDNSKDIITKFNKEGLITFISPACSNLLGYSPEELLSVKIFTLFHPDDLPRFREYQQLLQGSEAPNLIKHRMRNKNGDYLWFETNNQVIIDSESNKIKEIVAVSRDISEIIKTEEFRIAKEAAEYANKAKSDFLANMSHEIRNPMNAIIGLTNTLDRMKLDDSQKEIVRSLKISSSSLLNILNDILDFSKIEADKTELFEVEFSVDSILEEVHSIFKTSAEQKNLVFLTFLGEGIPPTLKGDVVKLKQIIINLCSNAIKFTEQGKVTLEVAAKSTKGNNIDLEFKVTDTGIGIDEKDFEKLFYSFTQLDSTTTKSFSGTGLGLTIVKKYIELMNGTISVSSKVGIGSTFTFTLPFTITSKKVKTFVNKKKPKNTEMKLKILLAEDDGINQMYLKSFLNDQGWEVDTAFNGLQALEKFDKAKYDIILMDGQMPKMDGFEATRTIREKEKVSGTHTPIIAITGYAVSGDKERFLDCGMDDYISKPVNEASLIEMIISYASPK